MKSLHPHSRENSASTFIVETKGLMLIASETQNFFIAWGNKDFRVD